MDGAAVHSGMQAWGEARPREGAGDRRRRLRSPRPASPHAPPLPHGPARLHAGAEHMARLTSAGLPTRVEAVTGARARGSAALALCSLPRRAALRSPTVCTAPATRC